MELFRLRTESEYCAIAFIQRADVADTITRRIRV